MSSRALPPGNVILNYGVALFGCLKYRPDPIGCFQGVDSSGELVESSAPACWERISRFQGQIPDGFPPVFIACDVSNPLLGESGCTAVYGPQKGLLPKDVPRMEAGVARMARLLTGHFSKPDSLMSEPGMGAAGGIALGLKCAGSARLISGSGLVSAWLELDRHLADCDVVITGEGRFDVSSLQGKGPGELVGRASAKRKKVFVFVGASEQDLPLPKNVEIVSISPHQLSITEALPRAAEFLFGAVTKSINQALQVSHGPSK